MIEIALTLRISIQDGRAACLISGAGRSEDGASNAVLLVQLHGDQRSVLVGADGDGATRRATLAMLGRGLRAFLRFWRRATLHATSQEPIAEVRRLRARIRPASAWEQLQAA